MAVLIYIIVSLILTLCNALDTVNVTTSLGTVIGLHKTISNIEYYSFKGIPYANVTERFKAPTPMTPWQSVVMAFDEGPMCPQPSIPGLPDFAYSEQNEDCLYMNIYTPQSPQQDGTVHKKLPVIVVIHGGGFFMGTGGSLMFGPEFFMAEKDVIIVTFNYRVGLFGFLSTGTKDAQGNAGMKDQVEALKWVKREIAHFDGDPSRVTILGISAGSASVVLHLVSPMSTGLFHGAIAHSGAALADWANIDASLARRYATRVAELLCCNTENTTTIVNCLRKMSTSAIIEATNGLSKEEDLLIVTSPVIETGEFYEDVFLPDTPSKLFDNLNVSSSVPLIIGTSKDEGMIMLTLDNKIYDSMDRKLHTFIPSSVKKQSTPEQINTLTQKLRQFYFNGGPVTNATKKGFVDVEHLHNQSLKGNFFLTSVLFTTVLQQFTITDIHHHQYNYNLLWTDYMFMYPTAQTVKKLVAKGNDVYLYNFVYQRVKYIYFWEEMFPTGDYEGVTHGSDAVFISYFPLAGQDLTDTVSDDYKMRKRLVKLWATFVKTGSPANTVDETIKDIKWPKVAKTSELTYLEINSTFSVRENYYKERVAFWDQLTLNSDTLNKDEL